MDASNGRPLLILLCGLPGSGKTTFARRRAKQSRAIRFSTDEWMADLGIDYYDDLRVNLQGRLDRLWRELLALGQSVILEDGTWTRRERDEIRRVAAELGAVTEIHWFDLAVDELWRRLEVRNASPPHGSAPIPRTVFEESQRRLERPGEAELALFDRFIVHT
jgi:predicted kinase